jgi:putative transposase
MKYRFMADHRGSHRVEKMAANLGVTRSGFYAWVSRGQAPHDKEDQGLGELIKDIQGEVKYRYGSPRMTRELRRRGRRVGHNRVARLMREKQLGARPRRTFRITTKSNHSLSVADNVLDRRFSVPAANRVWVSDITYIATAEGWMYLCVVLDLYSRRVVGWSMGRGLGTELVGKALLMAALRRRPPRELVVHSDRGCNTAPAISVGP